MLQIYVPVAEANMSINETIRKFILATLSSQDFPRISTHAGPNFSFYIINAPLQNNAPDGNLSAKLPARSRISLWEDRIPTSTR